MADKWVWEEGDIGKVEEQNMTRDSEVFSDEAIDAAIELAPESTEQRTRETREHIAKGETPALIGALTAQDLLRWIENAERKRR